ncbi:hypothetical protein JCGZ_10471 [Jatropha curcas]|uniref:Uncharacterized protein n=1 Tax=Jatropha curcas TaxID=180498 RepID=A0A067KV58_JATCU|nr:hypothetical protein JCGZ_10471 [Jatropha curcas]
MSSSRHSKSKALVESPSHEDEPTNLEADNLILGAMNNDSNSEDEINLIMRRLQEILFSLRAASVPQTSAAPPNPTLGDKTSLE